MESSSTIILTEDEQRKLLEIAATSPDLLKHRALLILAYAEGKPTLQASRESGISTGRARFWKRQFFAKRLAIFELAEAPVFAEDSKKAKTVVKKGKGKVPPALTGADKTLTTSAEIEIQFPQPRPQIGISLDDTLAEAGRKVWSYFFAEMLSHEAGTLLGENIEELHDMRVATRRMRSAFDIFGPAFDAKVLKRHLKGLRIAGRVLGQVRDMDVLLDKLLTYQKKLKGAPSSGADPLVTDWQMVIDQQRLKLVRHLQSGEYQVFKSNFNLFLQVPEMENYHVGAVGGKSAFLRDMVPVLVYSRYAAVRAYESLVPTASVIQLHALRIECKKFRYTLEYFKEILGPEIGLTINDLKGMQDHLGELHDADVACLLVRKFLKKLDHNQLQVPISERINPEPIVNYLAFLHAERYSLTRSFPELWKKFNRPEFRQRLAQSVSLL
jgi:CHAD domain-containing protein